MTKGSKFRFSFLLRPDKVPLNGQVSPKRSRPGWVESAVLLVIHILLGLISSLLDWWYPEIVHIVLHALSYLFSWAQSCCFLAFG